MKTKFSKREIAWILYDVANSAFVLLATAILPIYFKSLTDAAGISASDSTSYYSYALSVTTLIVLLVGPICATVGDNKNHKKPLFTFFMMMGVLGCAALAIPTSWILFLVIFVITRVGLQVSVIFYDAMIVDITVDENMDRLSSHGYAWGYIGSCIPFIVSLVIVLFGESLFGIPMSIAMGISFILNALWWFLVTIPLLRIYEQRYYVDSGKSQIKNSFKRLLHLFSELKENKKILTFLIAFFFYIDGVYTIISLSSSYGTDVGLDATFLLVALLVTQIVAFPFAILFGKLSKKYNQTGLISICIGAYFFVSVYGIFLETQLDFWILAICVGMFQGAIQALSRAHFAKLIPKHKSSEYFGIYDVFAKGASFTGTMLVGIFTQLFDSTRAGISSLSVLVALGFIFFQIHARQMKKDK